MDQRPLGQSGVTVPVVGLDCTFLTPEYGRYDEAASWNALAAALDLGFASLHTGPEHSLDRNEDLIGRFLKGRRDQVILAGAASLPRDDDWSASSDLSGAMKAACDESLGRLRTDVIDLYILSGCGPDDPVEDAVGVLADLLRAGKIRQIGLTGGRETLLRAHAVHPVAVMAGHCSLMYRQAEDYDLGASRAIGATFISQNPAIDKVAFAGPVGSEETMRQRPAYLAWTRRFQALADFASDVGVEGRQAMLAWLLCKHGHAVATVSISPKAELGWAVAAASIRLTPQQIAELQSIFTPLR